MYLALEPFQPYESALIWQQHRQYYQREGAAVFLKQEVPFNISSNPCLARQIVRLLLARPAAAAKAQNSLQILELGAGLGLLALNMLEALAELAPDQPVTYWLSDFSLPGLQQLAAHPAFAQRVTAGQLQIVCLDGQNPQQAIDLSGQPLEWPADGFDLVLANYFYSTLPTAVLLKQGEDWLRQHSQLRWYPLGFDPEADADTQTDPEALALFCQGLAESLGAYDLSASLPPEHPQRPAFEALFAAQQQVATALLALQPGDLPDGGDLRAWLQQALATAWSAALQQAELSALQAGLLHQLLLEPLLTRPDYPPEQLHESQRFVREAPAAIFASPAHEALVKDLVADWSLASVGYSAAGLHSLSLLLERCASGGLLLLNDKAYPDAGWMQGLRPESATRHGQSLAHPVNFPLFAALATFAGVCSLSTSAPENALHSLLICKTAEMPQALQACFETDFIVHPGNEISHALLEGGHALMQQGQTEAALRSFSRALRYRPQDGTLQYFAAVCHLNQTRYPEALALLQARHDDVFGLLNRAILLAESYRLLEQFAEALPHYQVALSYGANAQTLYNLALCQLALQQPAEAREALLQAAALDPDDAEIQELLASLV
ncbi:MAG: tetratricopeptide repeat protein [Candidatus Sericytochromatia bacterium]|nr:tetratricopeptide repeat protein [Candidatus Sericytochromatia bacterium]